MLQFSYFIFQIYGFACCSEITCICNFVRKNYIIPCSCEKEFIFSAFLHIGQSTLLFLTAAFLSFFMFPLIIFKKFVVLIKDNLDIQMKWMKIAKQRSNFFLYFGLRKKLIFAGFHSFLFFFSISPNYSLLPSLFLARNENNSSILHNEVDLRYVCNLKILHFLQLFYNFYLLRNCERTIIVVGKYF